MNVLALITGLVTGKAPLQFPAAPIDGTILDTYLGGCKRVSYQFQARVDTLWFQIWGSIDRTNWYSLAITEEELTGAGAFPSNTVIEAASGGPVVAMVSTVDAEAFRFFGAVCRDPNLTIGNNSYNIYGFAK